jgi:hypothetical protein
MLLTIKIITSFSQHKDDHTIDNNMILETAKTTSRSPHTIRSNACMANYSYTRHETMHEPVDYGCG